MGIINNFDVKESFLILTKDGNQIFKLDEDEVIVKYQPEHESWRVQNLNGDIIEDDIKIAYYATSNKILSFKYRRRGESKEQRKEMRLYF